MADPNKSDSIHGVVAYFHDVDGIKGAARKIRDAGFQRWDTYTPFPVHGIDEAMGIKPTVLPWIVLGMGLTGMCVGLLLQWYTNAFDYQFSISGKPTWSLPANIPVTFEVIIAFSAFTTFFGRPFWQPHRPARPEKSEGGKKFRLVSEFEPKGDQPKAIEELVAGLKSIERDQVLLGVTGSGKTFTMAKIIEHTQRPALIMAPNKTLAAQLYSEFKSFFPDNAVEYFVSYYDYYQPEAYVPRTDTFIEKDSSVNEQIDRMRHAATRAILERDDCIIVASVSCIYGIGSVETYTAMTVDLARGQDVAISTFSLGGGELSGV